ncbi:hypothetical protein HDU96_007468 [Phlyctochytrium bullatum]|nr:hypothetical protein HDU96_007468 [Phlyctochytrium bullatum]
MAGAFRDHISTKLALLTSQPVETVRPIVDRGRFSKGARISLSLSAIFVSETKRHRHFVPSVAADREEGIQEEEEEEDDSETKNTSSPSIRRPNNRSNDGNSSESDTKAELFRRCKELAQKWEPDDFIESVEAEGRCIAFQLRRERLFRELILQVAREGEKFGRDEFTRSLKQDSAKNPNGSEFNFLACLNINRPVIVEYELPGFGHRLEPSHVRGIFLTSFVVRSMRFARADVRSRCRIRVWSLDTGLVLAEYEKNGDVALLEENPLKYLQQLLDRANYKLQDAENDSTEDVQEGEALERRALQLLQELSSGRRGTAYELYRTILKHWRIGMMEVIRRYGGADELELETDEYEAGIFEQEGETTLIKSAVVEALRRGHPEAPLLRRKQRNAFRGKSTTSFAGNGDESDDNDSLFNELDDDSDDDRAPGDVEEEDPSGAIALDLRLGNKFGVAALTHEGGAPTSLAVDVATALIRGGYRANQRPKYLTFVVTSWSRHYRLLLARRVLELLDAWRSPFSNSHGDVDFDGSEDESTFWVEIPHGRILGMETDKTIPDDDGFSSPFRWLDLGCAHLRTISGKSSMVFPDDHDASGDLDAESWDPRSPGEANYVKVTGRDGVSDEVASYLATSAVMIQVLQSKRVKDCVFDWARIVDDKKDVGLYLQYAHARLCGIQRRSGVPVPFAYPTEEVLELSAEALAEFEKADLSLLARTPSAVDLASVMAQIPMAFGAAAATLDPSAFIPFLVSLARQISSGHNSMFVKGAPENVARARMALLWAARVAISGGLKLLGLTPMQKM